MPAGTDGDGAVEEEEKDGHALPTDAATARLRMGHDRSLSSPARQTLSGGSSLSASSKLLKPLSPKGRTVRLNIDEQQQPSPPLSSEDEAELGEGNDVLPKESLNTAWRQHHHLHPSSKHKHAGGGFLRQTSPKDDDLTMCVQEAVRSELLIFYGKLQVEFAQLRSAVSGGAGIVAQQRRGYRAHSGHSANTEESPLPGAAPGPSHEWIGRSMRSYAATAELAVMAVKTVPALPELRPREPNRTPWAIGVQHESSVTPEARPAGIRRFWKKQASSSMSMSSEAESSAAKHSSGDSAMVSGGALARGASRAYSSQSGDSGGGPAVNGMSTTSVRSGPAANVIHAASYGFARGDSQLVTPPAVPARQLWAPQVHGGATPRQMKVLPSIPSMRPSFMSSSMVFTNKKSSQEAARDVIRSPVFDHMTLVFILATTVAIGLQTEYSAKNLVETATEEQRIVDKCIAAFFTVELALKLWAFRLAFFTGEGWKWNVVDFVVVILQVAEEVLDVITSASSVPVAFSLVRMLRILRLVRVVRVLRVLRHMSDLRTIVVSMASSLKPLLSTMALLGVVVYIVGVYFTQLTLSYRIEHEGAASAAELEEYFGSVGTSMMSLFQTVTGGIDWRDVAGPLMQHISPFMGFVFAFYIAATSIALMNIVTGVFVEGALQRGREDRDVYMINQLRDLFESIDGSHSGLISLLDLESNLDNPRLVAYFKEIDIDTSEARGLFRLLDRDGSGTIDADEFLSGCLRLRGPAKALDLQLVMRELAEQHRHVKRLADSFLLSGDHDRPSVASSRAID